MQTGCHAISLRIVEKPVLLLINIDKLIAVEDDEAEVGQGSSFYIDVGEGRIRRVVVESEKDFRESEGRSGHFLDSGTFNLSRKFPRLENEILMPVLHAIPMVEAKLDFLSVGLAAIGSLEEIFDCLLPVLVVFQ